MIKMSERNNVIINEKAMGDQEQWNDQDERRKQWENGYGRSKTMEGSR